MVSSNKILTVSYGTFSCTLEGFDNSFDTMKAIAEYFRDLAQDDRYFGAEPPIPDAEMLARIAEREIERRVEARFEKGNLVLRPTDEAEPPQGDVAPGPSSDAALVGATVGVAATALAVADTEEEVGTHDLSTLAVGLGDVDMTKLDIRDDAVATDVLDLSDIDLSNLSLETDEDSVVTADDVLSDIEDTSDISSIEDLIAEQGSIADRLVAEAAQDAFDATEIEQASKAAVVTDSVADKLQRIRAVVASKTQTAPDYIEDEHAMSGPGGDGNDENDAVDADLDIPGFVDATDASDDAEAVGDNLFTDTIAAVVNDQIAADDDEFDDQDDAILPDMSFDDDEDDAHSELKALRAKIAQLEAQAAAAQPPVDEDTAALFAAHEDHDEDAPLFFDEADDEDDVAPEPLIARVSKAKRSDVEAALAAGDLEEYDDEDEDGDDLPDAQTAHPVPGRDKSTLTAEQEAELARELADLHAEIEQDEDWDFDDDDETGDLSAFTEEQEEAAHANVRKAVKMTSPARAMLTDTSIEEDNGSVDRLADKTETEMDEPEGNRRRSAIAHLRAAVAATKADRILGLNKKPVDEEVPYREDLADAVRPRRPKVTEARSERPAPVRPAPLKLVAEQRVDAAPSAATPVRPRRVMRNTDSADTSESMAADDTGFAEFADNQGAHTLPELLEAAAAYMSFVEGRDQFSRPQLMTKLLQAEGEASSREERLRSFGQLLREGKIEKKGGGRFAASDNIGFKPKSRAAG